MATARIAAAVSLVATGHFLIWFSAFSAAFGAVDTGESFPAIVELALGLVLNVLGAPLMFLLYLPALGTFDWWWTDDASFAIGLAVVNSLLWGFFVVWAYRFVRRRREARPDAA